MHFKSTNKTLYNDTKVNNIVTLTLICIIKIAILDIVADNVVIVL